ncbi:aminoglycoside phosphotransferase family protein [Coxiella endosymbiont of Amblyomma sculptum]|uniref:aminoglycoside phosphotransferase family protein n=1 Tax=Coxiella endosymbiont of Amblyomma sculptum TaxID=2487929 RepID=UPI00132E80C0|nr:aminoglycoside phosphotransferase family protein [Coxiella endosymbiont of Amblyomma sculptum]QHG92562.1 aminoglycoside phosphotransferase family protein [Coxiella endosymbiont of Amblyomma sculptum]
MSDTFVPISSVFDKVSAYFSLGPLLEDPVLISVGRLSNNEVWRLKTRSGSYALKRMSSESEEICRENEKIVKNFQNSGLSSVISFPKGSCLYGSYFFQLFDWIIGEKLVSEKITTKQTKIVGSLLANLHIHALDPSKLDLAVLNNSFHSCTYSYDKDLWTDVLNKAILLGIKESDQLKSLALLLMETAEKSNIAAMQLLSSCIIGHRDISPNNVLWKTKEQPVVLDWELSGLIHPTTEVIGTAFDWSVVNSTQVDEHRYQKLVREYVRSGGILSQVRLAFKALMGVWLNWFLYSLGKFVGGKDSIARVAEYEAIHTLLTFKKIYNNQEKWISLLR